MGGLNNRRCANASGQAAIRSPRCSSGARLRLRKRDLVKAGAMEFDAFVKLTIYRHFAETGQAPKVEDVAERVGAAATSVIESYRRLRALRVLVLEDDGPSIRMAPPFSGVPTQHVVEANGVRYFGNCAWDALGVPAALHRKAVVRSRCEQSGEPLHLDVALEGPSRYDWVFHCLVPASQWWDDIVFT